MFHLNDLLSLPLHSLHLRQIHSLLLTSSSFLRRCDHFLHRLLRRTSDDFLYARRLLSQIQTPDIQLWDSLVGHFSGGTTFNPRLCFLVYTQMRRISVVPSRHTFPTLLKAVSRTREADPSQFHAHIIKFGYDSDRFVSNSLVSAYCNRGFVEYGWGVFEKIEDKDVVSWTAMIDGFVRNDCAEKAMAYFVEMKKSGIVISEVSVASVLSASAKAENIKFGRSIHGFYIETGRVKWDVFIGSSLVNMYGKCGFCIDARKAFHEMPIRNVVSWTALIAAYVQCHFFEEGLMVFQEMLKSDVRPNEQTLTSVLSACAQLGALHQGRWVQSYMVKTSIKMNATLGTAMIDLYAKCGCLEDAVSAFEILPEKNVYTWTAMINGFAVHGDAKGALNLFHTMLGSGVSPNEVTLIGVLGACVHGGLVEEGRELFRSMKEEYNLDPNADHYACMVDLFGRKGLLQEALGLIEKMPMEPTSGVWGSLFASCLIHKDYELGEYAARRVIELQPNHSRRYALLANLYSETRNWDAVARVRKHMKDRKVEKTPGFSWIEVNGKIREFVACDEKFHGGSDDMYKALESLSCSRDLQGMMKN